MSNRKNGFRVLGTFLWLGLLAGLPGRAFSQAHGNDQIHQLAIQITNWNMSLWNAAADLPVDKTVDFPSGLSPDMIVSFSALVQHDVNPQVFPLRISVLGIPASVGPGGNVRIQRTSSGIFQFALHAFGAYSSSPNRSIFQYGGFVNAGHRGWIYVAYRGNPINTGSRTDLFTNVHSLSVPFGPWYPEPNQNPVRTLRIPSDIALSDIVDMRATFVNDDGTAVLSTDKSSDPIASFFLSGATSKQAEIRLSTKQGFEDLLSFSRTSESINRGWLVLHYKGAKSVRADVEPNFQQRNTRTTYALGGWDLGGVTNGVPKPVLTQPINSTLHDLSEIGGISALVKSDQLSNSAGFTMEDFNGAPVCREYLKGTTILGANSIDSRPYSCRPYYSAKGGNTYLVGGSIHLNPNQTGHMWKSHSMFSVAGTGTNPPAWRNPANNRGYVMLEEASSVTQTYKFRGEIGIKASGGQSQLFSLHVPEGASNVRITVEPIGGFGNPDLYVKKGRPPRLNDADCISASPGASELCTEGTGLSGPGDYYIRVYGGSTFEGAHMSGTFDYPAFRTTKVGDGLAGSIDVADGIYMTGSGSGIKGTGDNFFFASQSQTGDGEVVARIDRGSGNPTDAKCGLMLRSTLAGNSAHASVFDGGSTSLSQFQWRTSAGGGTSSAPILVVGSRDYYKLVKRGNTISAWAADRNSGGLPEAFWEFLGETTVSLGARFQAGLAVTNDNPSGLCDCVISGYQAKFYDAFQQNTSNSNNLVSIEAENFDGNAPKPADTWGILSASDASGATAVQTGPNNGSNITSGIAANSPRLDYSIYFARTGTHYLWARGKGATASDDSYHAGLNGTAFTTSDNISGFGTALTWSKSADGSVASFTVPTPGVHVLNIWMREDGFVLDKLVLTTSSTYTPSGSGPAESARSGQGYLSEYEGEKAAATYDVVQKTAPAGFPYMDYGATGAYLYWDDISTGKGGLHKLSFRQANGSSSPARNMRLFVNGADYGEKAFPYTGNWDVTWSVVDWTNVPLHPGVNTVKLIQTTSGGPNVDKITVMAN